MAKYANIIVDISLDKLDKTFQYYIPDTLREQITPGVQVVVPFGNRTLTGYVVELTDEAEFDKTKLKPVLSVKEGSVAIESQMIALAAWIRKNYGGTMNQALKTVLPVRKETKAKQSKTIRLLLSEEEAKEQLAVFEAKHNTARARLLKELIDHGSLNGTVVTK